MSSEPQLPPNDAPSALPLTGERTVPGVPHENYWFQRHVAAYAFAATRCNGRVVVDAGSGEGYGTAMLAEVAANATGVELVSPVVTHAMQSYPDATFIQADVCDTGFPTGSIDVVVNLQVIEHLPDVYRFLHEARRILRPGGRLIVATPNRLTFTPHSHEPANIFHVEEFTAGELTTRLRDVGGFTVDQMLGVRHGHTISTVETTTGRSFTDLVLDPPDTWPRWLRTTVTHLSRQDFLLDDRDIDTSLDLVAVCTR